MDVSCDAPTTAMERGLKYSIGNGGALNRRGLLWGFVADDDPGIDRKHTVLVEPERVDIELYHVLFLDKEAVDRNQC